MFRCKASVSVLYVYVLVACSLKSKLMWHCLVDYWVCYCMFRSMGTKVFPGVAWLGLMAGNVTDYCQSMSGFSRVAYPSLRLAGGDRYKFIAGFYPHIRFPLRQQKITSQSKSLEISMRLEASLVGENGQGWLRFNHSYQH
jgi:hypothetical protein